MKHKPTGLTVRSEAERSQFQNKNLAIQILTSKLSQLQSNTLKSKQNSIRQNQIGSGERGDKIRTYRVKDDRVVDHRTEKKGSLKHWLKGNLKI